MLDFEVAHASAQQLIPMPPRHRQLPKLGARLQSCQADVWLSHSLGWNMRSDLLLCCANKIWREQSIFVCFVCMNYFIASSDFWKLSHKILLLLLLPLRSIQTSQWQTAFDQSNNSPPPATANVITNFCRGNDIIQSVVLLKRKRLWPHNWQKSLNLTCNQSFTACPDLRLSLVFFK